MNPRRRVWRSRLTVVGLLLLLVAGAAVWLSAGGRRLDSVRAQLDQDEPGWQWADIQRQYEAGLPPDDRNPFVTASAVGAGVPKWFDQWLSTDPTVFPWQEVPVNRRPPADRAAELVCVRDELLPHIDSARGLIGRAGPSGYRYPFAVDVIGTLCQPVQDVRLTNVVLRLDAEVTALDGDGDRAIGSARAGVSVARAFGDDPVPVATLVRMAAARFAVESAERALALTEPTAGLGELQAELLAEAEFPRLRRFVRGERAMFDRFYDNFRTGRDSIPAMAARYGLATPMSPRVHGALFTFQRDGEHLAILEQATRLVRAADAPEQERRAAAAAMPPDPVGRSVVAKLFQGLSGPAGAYRNIIDNDLLNTARLRCAGAGLACERFRRTHGRWPKSLAELGERLPAVPNDPFTGTPLLYRRVPGGAVVYSVGTDGTDDGGNVSARPDPGTDVGFRLFDPDRRGLAE